MKKQFRFFRHCFHHSISPLSTTRNRCQRFPVFVYKWYYLLQTFIIKIYKLKQLSYKTSTCHCQIKSKMLNSILTSQVISSSRTVASVPSFRGTSCGTSVPPARYQDFSTMFSGDYLHFLILVLAWFHFDTITISNQVEPKL